MGEDKSQKECTPVTFKVLPVKILSIILLVGGILIVLCGIGFTVVRVQFQAYKPVFGYHIWLGLIIVATGALGVLSYKKQNKTIMIVAGVFGIICEIIGIIMLQFTIRLLFEKVNRTPLWMAEPEAEAAAKAETTAEPEAGATTAAEPEGSAEPEFAPIVAYKMDIFLQLSAILAVLYLLCGVCGIVLTGYTMRPGCSKVAPEDEKQPVA